MNHAFDLGNTPLIKRLIGALGGAACFASSLSALAADPVTAGSTNIGKHPTYPAQYSGFWRTGVDYTLLSDTNSTFLNAPSTTGGLYLSVGDTTQLTLNSKGSYFNTPRVLNDSVAFGTQNTGQFAAVMRIGTHPSYGAGYAAVWLDLPNCSNCGPRDYALLADSENTFLNASRGDRGVISFRAGNVDLMTVTSSATGGFRVAVPAYKAGGGSWLALSDARVKKDVVDFGEGLSALEKVHPVSFRYNGLAGMKDTKKQYVGVIAQELEQALPFMVSTDSSKLHPEDKTNTELKAVDPSAFTYVLINAVKQLSAQNKQMAAENRQMKRVLCADHPLESFCNSAAKN